MKKELVALLLLLLILAGNIWNQRRLDRLTAGLDRLTEKAFASARDAPMFFASVNSDMP